ncbi:acyl carrier protein [Paraglaciecola sp. MB-3u-78]|jgi:acyl carrier protein|uniref:acyl carrier protein n=1 Tax=Paraglaciecola sp. MB-3u-78 TaxID=2058332 RepID=UPI000C33AAFD|nr:acyl carrier protein [Paraglaciecola sp. MB-3u-78]PKG99528.1 phosphopantetheine-binding protein [Paraglaciecola sp. MB-3u-78]
MKNLHSLKDLVCKLILDIAPEADMQSLDPNEELREELDLDSMDFMNLLDSIAKETGVNVPESDYAKVNSLQSLTEYIATRR